MRHAIATRWRCEGLRRARRAVSGAAVVALVASLSGPDHAAAGWWSMQADLPGRWRLHTPTYSNCVLTFSGLPDGDHGQVAGLGFCPRAFLARPAWRLDGGRLVISRHHGGMLAALDVINRGRLEGNLITGDWVTLSR